MPKASKWNDCFKQLSACIINSIKLLHGLLQFDTDRGFAGAHSFENHLTKTPMQTSKLIHSLLILGSLTLSAASLHAQILTPIAVNDANFETPAISQGSVGTLEGTRAVTGVPYTDGGSFDVGITNPNTAAFTRTDANLLPGTANSTQAMVIDGFQDETVATYQGSLGNYIAGDTYTLTVAIGDAMNDVSSGETGGTYHLDLLLNGSAVASTTGTATVGNFTDLTLTFTATSADTGAIGFDLGMSSNYVFGQEQEGFFDNVRLTQDSPAAVPEPSSSALVVAGLLAAVAFGVQRRRALDRV